MNWVSSGIEHEWLFEAVSHDLETSYGFIDGITGGTLTEAYRADYRSSASLECFGTSIPENCLVRVWHMATLDGETVREEMGTFVPTPYSGTYINGRYVGTLDMQSTLIKLGGDVRSGNRGVQAGTDIVGFFESIVKGSYCVPSVPDSIASRGKTFPQAHIWQSQTSVLSECHRCAESLNAMVGVDTHGRVTLSPYVAPTGRSESMVIDRGLLPEVDIDRPDIINKVVCDYQISSGDSTVSISEMATVDGTHPWHPSRIGRWSTETYYPEGLQFAESDSEAYIRAVLKAYAKARLDDRSNVTTTYSARGIYRPVSTGEVVRFRYYDGEGHIDVKAMVSSREVKLDATAEMMLSLEEV